jgi:tetratricopeptide (TPR) repeat protein
LVYNAQPLRALGAEIEEQNSTEKLIEEADFLRNQGDTVGAIRHYRDALRRIDPIIGIRETANCHHMIGVCFKMQNDFPRAVHALSRAHDIYEGIGDRVGAARVLRDLGVSYDHQGDHRTAVEILHQSEEALSELDVPAELGITQAKIGESYAEAANLEMAAEWLHKGLATIRTTDSWFYEMTALIHLGKLQLRRENPNGALTYLWAALARVGKFDTDASLNHRLTQLRGHMANGYVQLGNNAMAHRFFEQFEIGISKMDAKNGTMVLEDVGADSIRERIRGHLDVSGCPGTD